MTLGSLLAGFLGDRYGRRFTYQFNLMIFGLASLAAAFAPDINVLNGLRLIMGVGLGAEIVVGYGTMTEFIPPQTRGKWMAFMAFVVVSGLPATAILGWAIVRVMGGGRSWSSPASARSSSGIFARPFRNRLAGWRLTAGPRRPRS